MSRQLHTQPRKLGRHFEALETRALLAGDLLSLGTGGLNLSILGGGNTVSASGGASAGVAVGLPTAGIGAGAGLSGSANLNLGVANLVVASLGANLGASVAANAGSEVSASAGAGANLSVSSGLASTGVSASVDPSVSATATDTALTQLLDDLPLVSSLPIAGDLNSIVSSLPSVGSIVNSPLATATNLLNNAVGQANSVVGQVSGVVGQATSAVNSAVNQVVSDVDGLLSDATGLVNNLGATAGVNATLNNIGVALATPVGSVSVAGHSSTNASGSVGLGGVSIDLNNATGVNASANTDALDDTLASALHLL